MQDALKAAQRKRRWIQTIAAVLFLSVLIGGWYEPYLGYFIPACMLFGLGVAAFRGRLWCNWMCPRGSFYDRLTPISPMRRLPSWLRRLPLRSTVLALLMVLLVVQLSLRWPDPRGIGKAFLVLLTITTGIGVLAAVLLHPRTWCFVCPIGTMSNWIGGHRLPVRIESDACVSCKRCGKVCPVQVEPHAFKAKGNLPVADRDCLRCGLCVAACPKDALSKRPTP